MHNYALRISGLLVIAAFYVVAAPDANARAGNVLRGRGLAIEACSACHRVTAAQRSPAPVADPDTLESVTAPSFTKIGRKYRRRPTALRSFILAPDHPMREQQFIPGDLNDIVAYIRSLGSVR